MSKQKEIVVFREVKVGEYVLRFWPSDNGWMCGITSEMMQALTEQSAQQALDKKAENARELGLDYEPAQQEPVAWMSPHGGFLSANYINNFASGLDKEIHNIPLYTLPPAQRTWVGLTDEEIRPLCNQVWVFDTVKQWVQIIEAKLKEKNNG
jgi:hypothetical protein